MKLHKSLLVLMVAGVASVAVFAQDPVKVEPTHYKVLVDNAAVRVLHVQYAAGAKGAMHHHPDAVVVSLSASKVHFGLPEGKSQDSDMANESAMYTPAGLHSPENTGKTGVDAIVIEMKAPQPGTAALPASREGMTLKMLAEGPRATAYRSTAAATFGEPAGTTHKFDQVVIALAPTQMSLKVAGQPDKTSWARGDVMYIGRGVAHEAKNTGGKVSDMIIVAIK
jgi:mannose-6-phosphate isomerase-like protein (cupin superfamily)